MSKRILLLPLLLVAVLICQAQKPSLNKAYNLFYERDFEKAKAAIDLCTADDKLSQKANTWLYAGNIAFYLGNQEYEKRQQEEGYKVKYPATPVEAYDAFQKAKSLNKFVEATDMLSPDEALPKLYPLLLIYGVDELLAQRYVQGNSILAKAVESYEMQTPPEYPLEGELYYYYAYSFEMLHNTKQAVQYYEKALADHSNNVNVYLRLIENSKENPERHRQLIAEAKQKFPGNAELSVLEANRHIADTNYVEAEKLLRTAYARESGNYVVIYNLAVCCYYISQNKFAEANQFAVAGNKEQSAIVKEESDRYLDDAERYFEKALQMDSKDLTVMNILKNIYAKKQSPKYDEIVKKIEQTENK